MNIIAGITNATSNAGSSSLSTDRLIRTRIPRFGARGTAKVGRDCKVLLERHKSNSEKQRQLVKLRNSGNLSAAQPIVKEVKMPYLSVVFAALLALFMMPGAGWAKPQIRNDKARGVKPPIIVVNITSQCINGVPTITVTLDPVTWGSWQGSLYYHLNPQSPGVAWSPNTNPATFTVPRVPSPGILQITNSSSSSTTGAGIVSSAVYPYTVATCGTTSCVRHDPVGFFTTPEVLGELAQVHANCYPQPVCTGPTNLETIQCDGYTNFAGWLWSGPSTSTFTVAQQDAIINKAIVCAATPPGKVIVSIAFFRDIIVGPVTTYVIYCRVTFASCSQSQKGMTWVHSASNAQTGTITVGCSGCDPKHGDTPCTQPRPLLCIYKPTPPFQLPTGVSNADQYNRWSGGVVATTQPVAGMNSNAANSYCQSQFGPGWRVAEFHDGWGWNFQAYGGTVSAPTVPSTRFWVYINDQPAANCP